MGERAVTTDVTVAADADALQLQRLELESEATGDIPRSVIQAIFESKRRDHQACYEQALRRNRAMIFRLNVRLVVGVGGEVAYLRTSYDGQLDDEAVQCVEQSIRPLRFPAPGDGPVIVSYPIHFSQSAPQKAKTPPTSSYGYPSGSLPVQSTSSPILQKKEPPRTKN